MSKLRPDITVEGLNARGKGCLPAFMGVEVVAVQEHSLSSRMAIRPVHLAPNSYLHAASIVALADTTCGYATIAHLPEGAQSFTTIELKSNHLGTLREGARLRGYRAAPGAEHPGLGRGGDR